MIGWFRRVMNAAGNVVEQIARAALRIAEAFWHKFVALGHLSVHAWDWMVGAGETVARLVIRSAHVMERFARDVILVRIPGVIRWAGRQLADLENLARGLVRKLGEWTRAAVDALDQYARDLARFVRREVLDRLLGLIEGAVRWIKQEVIPFLRGLIDTLADWARAALRELGRLLSDAWDWIKTAGLYAYKLVKGAEAWLLFLAKLPFEVARAAFDFFRALTPGGMLAYVLRAFEREGGAVEEWLARWLGED